MNEKVGKFIKELREKKKMSQTELASLMGVSRQAISQWENGMHLPDIEKLNPLADILGVNVAELLEGEYVEDQKKQNDILVNEMKEKQKQKKKIIKTFSIIVVILVSILLAFLVYYFVNSYKSLKIYSVTYQDENLKVDGVIVLSRTETYYNIISNKNTKTMELYVKDRENKNEIVTYVEDMIITIKSNSGNSSLKYDNIDTLKNNLYLKITTQDNKDYDVQLTVHKFSENSNLLFFNKSEIIDGINEDSNLDIPEKIKKEFKLEGDAYTLIRKEGNKKITMKYFQETKIFEVMEEYENYHDSWNCNLQKNKIIYQKMINGLLKENIEIDNINDEKVKYFYETYYKPYILGQ